MESFEKIKIKPCPFCGSENITVKLHTDCYSSWAKVQCQKCYAFSEAGTDKPNSTCPNPVDDWENDGINLWNKRVCKQVTQIINRDAQPELSTAEMAKENEEWKE